MSFLITEKKTRVKHVLAVSADAAFCALEFLPMVSVCAQQALYTLAAGCAEKDVSDRAQFVCDASAEAAA